MAETKELRVLSNEVQEESVKFLLVNKEETEVFELILFKKDYDKDKGEWHESAETTEKYFTQLQDGLGVMSDDNLEELTGKTFELFVDEEKGRAYTTAPSGGNGLTKPTLEQEGDLESGKIVDVIDEETNRIVVVDVDGVKYGVNFRFASWVADLNKFLVNAGMKVSKIKKYKDLTGCEWEDTATIIGKSCMVEFKAFNTQNGKVPFVELKKLKKK